jgi:hypothetical protein
MRRRSASRQRRSGSILKNLRKRLVSQPIVAPISVPVRTQGQAVVTNALSRLRASKSPAIIRASKSPAIIRASKSPALRLIQEQAIIRASKSPVRRASKSPVRRASKSPVRRASKSPVRRASKSPSITEIIANV